MENAERYVDETIFVSTTEEFRGSMGVPKIPDAIAGIHVDVICSTV
jgi:hypothetical protein